MRLTFCMTGRRVSSRGWWRRVPSASIRPKDDARQAELGALALRAGFIAPLALAVLLIGRGGSLAAQESRGAITGIVREAESAEPLAGVEIRLLGSTLTAVTGEQGRFRIDGVPVGRWTIEARLLGRTTAAASATVASGSTADVELRLSNNPMSLEQLVVTATRMERSLVEAPAAVTVVTSDEIANRGAHRVADALVGTPSVRITDYSDGFSQGIQIRSLGESGHYQNAEVLVLVDGVPQLNANSQSFLDQVPFEQVERIEVVRGPSSALYGRNAIAGTVNIITRRPSSVPNLSAELSIGSFGSVKPRLSGGAGLGERAAFLLSASLERVDGWRERTDRESEDVFAKLFVDFGAASAASFTVQHINLRQRLASQIPLRPDGRALPVARDANFNLIPDHGTSNEMTQFALSLDQRLGSVLDLSFIGYLRSTDRLLEGDGSFIDAIDEDNEQLIMYPFDSGLEERVVGAEPRLVWNGGVLGRSHQLTVGLSYEHSSGTSPAATIADPEAGAFGDVRVNYRTYELLTNELARFPSRDGRFEVDNYGAYVQSELRVTARTTITTGLRWDRQSRTLVDSLRGSDREGSYSRVTPRIAVNHAWSPDAAAYITYGEGFNPPFGAAFQFDREGVEELEPERAHNFELGVKLGLMERRLTLSSALFHMKRRDLVQTVRQDNRSVQVNAGALDVTGFEIEARASLDPLIDGLSAHGSYAYSDPVWQEYVLGGVDFADKTPVNVSRHVASAGIDWSAASGALGMGAWADHVGAWYMDRANTVESAGFTIFNARVTAAPALQQHLSVSIQLLNVFDVDHFTRSEVDVLGDVIAASPGRPRRLQAVLRYRW